MALAFNISPGSATPVYRQITDRIRQEIATGKLAVGDQLPSVRALAESLVLNPNTVARAYADLARDGLIEAQAGRGVFVIEKRRVFTREEARRRLEPLLNNVIAEALSLDLTIPDLKELMDKRLKQWTDERGGKRNER